MNTIDASNAGYSQYAFGKKVDATNKFKITPSREAFPFQQISFEQEGSSDALLQMFQELQKRQTFRNAAHVSKFVTPVAQEFKALAASRAESTKQSLKNPVPPVRDYIASHQAQLAKDVSRVLANPDLFSQPKRQTLLQLAEVVDASDYNKKLYQDSYDALRKGGSTYLEGLSEVAVKQSSKRLKLSSESQTLLSSVAKTIASPEERHLKLPAIQDQLPQLLTDYIKARYIDPTQFSPVGKSLFKALITSSIQHADEPDATKRLKHIQMAGRRNLLKQMATAVKPTPLVKPLVSSTEEYLAQDAPSLKGLQTSLEAPTIQALVNPVIKSLGLQKNEAMLAEKLTSLALRPTASGDLTELQPKAIEEFKQYATQVQKEYMDNKKYPPKVQAYAHNVLAYFSDPDFWALEPEARADKLKQANATFLKSYLGHTSRGKFMSSLTQHVKTEPAIPEELGEVRLTRRELPVFGSIYKLLSLLKKTTI